MESPGAAAGAQVVGRETELAALHAYLDGTEARAFVLAGEPGIGKTTLWQAGVDAAHERGFRVLATRASGAEARMTYASLIDLLDGVETSELATLPEPQRYALEVAVLRTEPSVPPSGTAVALGLLNAMRALAGVQPLLLAVDDVPWLDAQSAAALSYAARRLDGVRPHFLLARRPGRPSTLELALANDRVEWLELGSLSYGAIRRMLAARFDLVLPRHLLRRLVDTTLGNPLFALEVGRELAAGPLPAIGEELPVPEAVDDMLGRRVARLPAETRRLLLATALSADLTLAQLTAIADAHVVEGAVDDGLLLVDGDRVRPSHPLLAAAARKRSRPRARRELHLALAGVTADDELQARHLALATEAPDEGLAATVGEAAAGAAIRGATREAVELAEHALRLTPAGSAARTDRLLALAGHLDLAGEAHRVTGLLEPELESLPPGAPRVRAHLLLSEGGGVTSVTDHQRHLEAALTEAGVDPSLRAGVLAKQSIHATAACVERVADAEALALEALGATSATDGDVAQLALHGLAWARALAGRQIDDVEERLGAGSGVTPHLIESVDRVKALRLTWRGEIVAARTLLAGLLALADERGESWSYAVLRLHLCELELRAGDWGTATRLLDEWAESVEGELLVAPSYERCRALLAAGRGHADDVERWAAPALAGAEATGARWQTLETLRAQGIAALLAHDPARAVACLHDVWHHTEREGVADPGAFPVAPELVEALADSGRLDAADVVTERLRELVEAQGHPWGLAAVGRCVGLIALADGSYDDDAAGALGASAAAYAALGMRFDAARSSLLLGRAQRRHRRWAAARESLDRAAAAFDEIGSPGWAADARSELERVGARRPRPVGQLTPAELRVAELAAEGLSNKEIAQTLVVTVNTVETHLSHAYAKLGLRSRAQLSRVDLAQR